MQVHIPDPNYTSSPRAKRNFMMALRINVGFILLIWGIFLLDRVVGLELYRFGLLPQTRTGLAGLIMTPLLHASWQHLLSNTVPLLVAGTAMLYLYPNSAVRAVPVIYFGSSLVVWVFGRPDLHIGASGLIYGLLAYVFVGGILRRDMRSIGVSLLIWFLYGSMLSGILPSSGPVSWELHLAGFILGVVLAIMYRHWDRPPRKRYTWEDEEDDSDSRHRYHPESMEDGQDKPWIGGDR